MTEWFSVLMKMLCPTAVYQRLTRVVLRTTSLAILALFVASSPWHRESMRRWVRWPRGRLSPPRLRLHRRSRRLVRRARCRLRVIRRRSPPPLPSRKGPVRPLPRFPSRRPLAGLLPRWSVWRRVVLAGILPRLQPRRPPLFPTTLGRRRHLAGILPRVAHRPESELAGILPRSVWCPVRGE